ncbi:MULTISPECIES: ParB/RepB/Spo0J family partition protein [unclassified Coleofasciculus]|uniref:ParB/RepB/Spo0J family partition protein n=1 Tax=Cyanophyceae TaxID=3028117 RepID=UPI0016842A5C|nr:MULTISPECIES: ParB/RepB/Spo0J family partition protein [unclassified Coleofasciculus]MBD1889883.1 ParB/RepB/Spo0J family partition protein [Coleofasciculus sp. FACHB-SPT9]MBD1895557.1 ParB/RepB/Spo0J family partition protein [Coleofasciculus sp. FACHB-129]
MAVKKSGRTAPELKTLDAYLSKPSEPSTSKAPIDKIRHPLKQPRRYFAPDKLAQLVESVKEHGILEPLLVRPLEAGEYELVAGERRLRAARDAGLTEVPIVSRALDDKQALQIALMENLQREDLNPLEETEGVLELLAIVLELDKSEVVSVLHQSYNAKQRGIELNQNVLIQLEKIESLLSSIGRFNAGTFRSSRLPLLNLPSDVLEALRKGELEYTKAMAIARVKDEQLRSDLLSLAIAENLSLNEIKAHIKELKPQSESTPQRIMLERLSEISKRLQKSKTWGERKKRERIARLLDELDKLTKES